MRRLAAALAVLAAALPVAAAAFSPTDPLAARQWYLAQDRPFDLWAELPILPSVKVGVVDSGIDLGHPEFAGKVAAARSFVGGTVADENGHGTFVAGEIAATLDNGQGIAGLAFPAQLVVAKVVRRDGTIDPADEARAIRWVVDQGARVVNLSLGGLRDPANPARDSYSAAESAAAAYAVSRGALVVAAVGNGDEAPRMPWGFASYPAALPHVLGVGALGRSGNVSSFSNRDAVFVDLVAPGEEMLSTLPRSLTAARSGCAEQGYSDCGPPEFERAAGTSFAAPQVTAAAALVLGERPDLRAEQVGALLERSAADASGANGCPRCAAGRDALSGWGRLDVFAALSDLQAGEFVPPDRFEPNDDAGSAAHAVYGRTAAIAATADRYDDPVDVYRIYLRKGQLLLARVGPDGLGKVALALWRPRTKTVAGSSSATLANRLVRSRGGSLAYRARVEGWHYLEALARRGVSGPYLLSWTKS